jgi:hypothetical protein
MHSLIEERRNTDKHKARIDREACLAFAESLVSIHAAC